MKSAEVPNFVLGLRIQTLAALALTALLLFTRGSVAAVSSLLGGLAVFIPGFLFTALVASRLGADTGAFLRVALVAEVGKLVLTGVLCALVFIRVRPLAPGWFFAGMIAVLAAGWVGLAKAFAVPPAGGSENQSENGPKSGSPP